MELEGHLRLTGNALKRWLIAQSQSALFAAILWLLGLEMLHVPWAPLWALLAFFFHFVPHLGPVLALLGPGIAAGVSGGWERLLYVLILYVVVVVMDALLVQPVLLKHHARVPVWATLLAPVWMAFFVGFWGVVVAAPLLAVLFAYLAPRPLQGEVLPPERPQAG
ncbi:MAG TPA: AI-2E family transporter [Terriglobales bacterium]|jgi:predicted PurR-regulated permease PerM|nr:AI-2E family transporter [Terriglobales bacterium]